MTPADRLAGREVRRILLEDSRHGLSGGLALERAAAGQHLVEDDAEREQVRAAVNGLTTDLFGCHVADRAEHSSWICADDRLGRVALAHRLGQTEIQNLHLPVTREKQVLGLQIAVDDTFAVRGREATRDLADDVDGFPGRERRSQTGAKRVAFEELSGGISRPGGQADIEDCEDVRMRERGHGSRFPLESRAPIGIVGDAGRQDLNRDVTPEPRVAGPIDLAHAACSEWSEDLVGPDSGAGRETQEGRIISQMSWRPARPTESRAPSPENRARNPVFIPRHDAQRLSASIASIRAARRAGMAQAASATGVNVAPTSATVVGSSGVTPKRRGLELPDSKREQRSYRRRNGGRCWFRATLHVCRWQPGRRRPKARLEGGRTIPAVQAASWYPGRLVPRGIALPPSHARRTRPAAERGTVSPAQVSPFFSGDSGAPFLNPGASVLSVFSTASAIQRPRRSGERPPAAIGFQLPPTRKAAY